MPYPYNWITFINLLMFIHLFAIVANVNQEGLTVKGRKIVEAYLKRYLSNELMQEHLRLFDNYLEFYKRELDQQEVKDLKDNASLISFQISNISYTLGLLFKSKFKWFFF